MTRIAPWTWLKLFVALSYFFMLMPILVTVSVSFNEGSQSAFPPQGFSLRWWQEAFSDKWLMAIVFSLKLSTVSAILSTAMALPLAFGLVRREFPGKRIVVLIVLGPLLLPTLVTGIGLLQLFHWAGVFHSIGFGALLIGHIVICLPFSVRTIAVSLNGLSANLEAAAASLGATRGRILIDVILPLIRNGLVAGALFSFIHSFTDVNLSLFLAGPATSPITVKILGFLEFGFAPTLAALSTISLLIPLVGFALVQRFAQLGEFVYEQR
ncbi:ABC transporter permease [Psychromarinibacter halotolerans]|uniref:ABC transporter permease n=1 Tax=Psychromarinibacter halotolerans TaxID=1775175 RepID=A0ABV7GTN3_9RHOB|nr:ABC transporter permease [Psychromarinibacter halotolerans]MDF0597542.1 ABC transporter permease [Psychromarinibacter halotolerans]